MPAIMSTCKEAPCQWPGFREGGLILPLPATDFSAMPPNLQLGALKFTSKPEFHATLLNRKVGARVLMALGDEGARQVFEEGDWTWRRTGEGVLIQEEVAGAGAARASLIERLELPELARFRCKLARQTGIPLPEVVPHVTLFTAGDERGIGIPDLKTFRDLLVASVPLPFGIHGVAPHLATSLVDAYRSTDFVVEDGETVIRIDEPCPSMNALLDLHQASRAIVVTACNPFSEAIDARANELRQQLLAHDLARAEIRTMTSEGRDRTGQWPPEPGYLAFGTGPDLEEDLMRRYGQHAIVAINRGEPAMLVLHPAHGDWRDLTDPPRTG